MFFVKKLAYGVMYFAAMAAVVDAQAASASLYVQDGLIACWDGIENAGKGVHDPAATVWKDLVGGYEFALNNTIVGDDCMTFTGEKSGGYITTYGVLSAADTVSTFVAARTGTVEIVYRAISTAATQVFLQAPPTSGIAFGIYQTSSFLNFSYNSTNNKQGFAFTSGTDVNLVSMRYSDSGPVSAIGNGNTLSRQNSGYWGSPNASATYIGSRANRQSDPFNGAIYCIRLYSRQLTDEEIAANQEVDRKRFILHVGPDILNVTTSEEGVSSPSPAYGFVRGIGDGQTVSVSCGNAVVTNSNGSVYSCTGWKIFDENSALVSSGSDTAFTYTHPTPAAYRELQWQWEMTSPPTKYVQNGLLAFWDGIENAGAGVHKDNATVWKDLVGGREFTLNNVIVDANCMTFAGDNKSYGILSATDTASTFLAAKSGTLEIVYRSRTGTGSQVIMQSTGAAGLAYAIWETSKILPYTSSSQGSQQSFSFSSGTFTNFVAVRYSSSAPISVLANGSELHTAGGSSWANPGSETIIGTRYSRSGSNAFPGSIYAIRLYDRQLTNPEILANQALDRSRFSQDDRESMLAISSTHDGLGSPAPGCGYLVGLSAGDARIVSCGEGVCSNSAETAEYVCDGWKLFDDSGTVVDSGTGQSFTYTHPSPAAFRRLEWQWRATSVRGTISAGVGGSVTVSGTAWYATDTPVNLAATPDSGKGFIQWTGTVPTGISGTSASFDFTPTVPFELTANFGPSFYVAKTGNDGNPGTEELPFATISNAIEKAAAEIDANGGSAAVHIASGTYEETGFVIDRPIVVIGDDRDTVNIYDAVQKSRAFTIVHPQARVANLTISGTGYNSYNNTGGHVQMSAGTVENCIIRDGKINQSDSVYSGGANVHISGGRLVRCQVLDGVLAINAWNQKVSYGAGVYASGGIVDSCLIKGNQSYNNGRCGGIYVSGDAKVVNCTVTGNLPPPKGDGDTITAGIHIGSAEAKVVNCVFYGNGDGSAKANFGTANLNRFFNCASSVDNPSCATWKVLTDDDFAEYAAGNLRPRAGSQLIDNGSKSRRPADGAAFDLDGENRISGEAVDIGAWEYDQSQLSCGGHPSSYSALEQSNVVFYATAIGTASDIVFRWDYGNGTVEETQESAHVYAYPASGLFTVRLSASPDGGASWCEWYTVPTRMVVAPETMYVDSNCATPVFPYKTRDTAAATLGAAYGALTNNVSAGATCVDGAEIVILKGSRLTETDMHLESAVTIRGDTDDPSDVEIVDAVQKSRAFAIVHPQARVANLTISGTGYNYYNNTGGHVQMSAGKVENCIIREGRINQSDTVYSGGGNVHISGGRLSRCQVLGGVLAANAWNLKVSYGAGVYASGGIVDSCLIKGNQSYNNGRCGGIYVSGDAKVVNCTVTGNLPPPKGDGDTVTAGIHIGSAGATVVNCVLYGNGDGSAKANFGNANLDRFFYCGSSVTNESCATWTVLTDADFVDYAGGDLRQNRYSQLVNRGTLDPAYFPEGVSPYDLSGNIRVEQRAIDLGCWEVLSSVGSLIIVR